MAICPLHPEINQGDSEVCRKCGQIIVIRKDKKRVIEKKILPEFFDATASGKKKYELRLADFDVSEGDVLKLREWDANKKDYTGREIAKKVTYVRKFKIDDLYWSLEEILEKGLYVLSIE